jgi:hypothetical protein
VKADGKKDEKDLKNFLSIAHLSITNPGPSETGHKQHHRSRHNGDFGFFLQKLSKAGLMSNCLGLSLA